MTDVEITQPKSLEFTLGNPSDSISIVGKVLYAEHQFDHESNMSTVYNFTDDGNLDFIEVIVKDVLNNGFIRSRVTGTTSHLDDFLVHRFHKEYDGKLPRSIYVSFESMTQQTSDQSVTTVEPDETEIKEIENDQ